ncbi:hypothetical protein FB45DRAFT_935365 [Roridomyces roridus]|uniref:Uncharacterized protein n=1 Tax=Roridomyces roridus TaxID=1738132 RepID=A0AAD7FF86_9AGAR|nr:hypothetical protein FB45DRAFT_935365 [Roridomyces roridus]
MLPALRELCFHEDIGSLGPFVEDMIRRSGCSLTTMAFSVRDSDVDAVKSCLSFTPALRDLQITCRDITSETLDAFFTLLRRNKKLVPCLASLQFHNCQTKVDLPSLVEMLTARRDGGSLRRFKMDFEPELKHGAWRPATPELNRRLAQLRALRSGELEVDIHPEAQWLDGYDHGVSIPFFWSLQLY